MIRLSLLGFLSVIVIGCSLQGAPVQHSTVQPSVSNPTVLTQLNASAPSSIYTDQTFTVSASGGKPPYTFSVMQGQASLTPNGLVSSMSAGALVIRVTDMANQTAQAATFASARPASTPTPTPQSNPCALPWGGTIAHGQSVVAFQASTITCPSAAACNSQVRSCSNGTLSGSFTRQSCSYRACVFLETDYATQIPAGEALCAGLDRPTAVPLACPAAQYNVAKYCWVHVNYGADSELIHSVFTCRGPDEIIIPQYHYTPPDTGGGGGD